MRSTVCDSYATLGLSLRVFSGAFRTGLSKSSGEFSLIDFIDAVFQTRTAVDGSKLRFSRGAAMEDGEDYTKGIDVVDPVDDTQSIEL